MEYTKTLLIFLLIFNNPVFASTPCPQNVQPISQGQVANCNGFLFSPYSEQDAEMNRANADYYKTLSDEYKAKSEAEANESNILDQRLKLYQDANTTLIQNEAKKDSTESWIRLGYFVLGVITTGLVARNVRQ